MAIPRRAGRQTPGRIQVSGAGGSRWAPRTGAAGSSLAPATGEQGVQAGQTERVEVAGIAWETEASRQTLAVAPRAGEAHLAELRVEGAKAARKRAVRGAHPVWAALVAVAPAAADGGGNQS